MQQRGQKPTFAFAQLKYFASILPTLPKPIKLIEEPVFRNM